MGSSATRRGFLVSGAAVAGLVGVGVAARWANEAGATTIVTVPGEVTIVAFSDSGAELGKGAVAKVVKTEEEWEALLSPLAYRVLRQEGTERAFTGEHADNHDSGLYRCAGCDTALFHSKTKYDSGTGWPSYWQPIAAENIIETSDRTLGMLRTAVSCARCEGHLGHVFSDGPPPTGLRYCMNSIALKFVPLAAA